ncbi:MAG TPA: DUF4347 domain-containing protein, partial [Oculatellaceae cyanobacterium]
MSTNSDNSSLNINEIIFIDPTVADYESLLAGVGSGVETFILDPNTDGISQISNILGRYTGISSVHIVSHGSAGSLQLGNTQLNSNTLNNYATFLQSWGNALTTDADILLYGCDVAAGNIGTSFIGQLSQLTGADVAASNDLTGSAALGGDWELEVETGTIESALAFDVATTNSYASVLAANDNFSNRTILTGTTVSTSGSNTTATGETGEPNHAAVSGTLNSVWYSWTAPTSGTTTINTIGSGTNFDTTLSVYTGTTVSSLTPIGSNDDYSNVQSQVSFNAVAGTTYHIAVDGYQSATGSFVLNIAGAGSIPTLSINDVSIAEGDTGTTNATFTVSLSAPSSQTVTVNYGTSANSATSGSDYTAVSSTLTFNPGVTSQTITVPIVGDTFAEGNETFFVNLSGATNATIADSQGIGTIINNDSFTPAISINDVTITEGDSGTSNATFTVSLSVASSVTTTVNYATANNTATAGSDYTALSGTLTFNPGVTNQTITVPIVGDTVYENNETFFVNLSGANVTIADSQGIGTINNNDSATPAISINDVTITEGDSGTSNATFTVSLSAASGVTTTVNYATANNTATAGSDYTALSGTLTFNPGLTSQTITVPIVGDTVYENNETFFVNLSGANVTIADSQGIGTINNNDLPPFSGIERVNVESGSTTQANGNTWSWNDVSDNGRYIAFVSDANNLVTGDTNAFGDVFVRDRSTGRTIRASVDIAGSQANSSSYYPPSISSTGQYVAFFSHASNLVANDTNGQGDIFVRDIIYNTTTRVSVAADGVQANASSSNVSISADSRYVVFKSAATNLVANDTNAAEDIFVHDRNTGQTRLVSVGLGGVAANSSSNISNSAISDDGRYITFASSASNLVSNDTNNSPDVFVFDQTTGQISRVNIGQGGVQSNSSGGTMSPSISGNGQYIAFQSSASNLVANDTNNSEDIFVHDRTTAQTSRVSVTSTGQEVYSGGSTTVSPKLSNDGRYVAFNSASSSLVAGDTNNTWDIFVSDRTTGSITRVNNNSTGNQANGESSDLSIAGDGSYVVFGSSATNLVTGDTNAQGDIFFTNVAAPPPNTNSAPNGLGLSPSNIRENVPSNSIVGNLSTYDPDTGNTFTYSLVSGTGSTDNPSFSIVNGNQLRINSSPNFESKSSYNIRVRTTDQGGLSYEGALPVTIINVNEAPIITGGSDFKITGLSANNAYAIEHNTVTGDDRGGIAVSASKVFYTGDSSTGGFALNNLSGGTSVGQQYDALFSNLATGDVFTFASNNTTPLTFTGGTITHLLSIDGTTGQLST